MDRYIGVFRLISGSTIILTLHAVVVIPTLKGNLLSLDAESDYDHNVEVTNADTFMFDGDLIFMRKAKSTCTAKPCRTLPSAATFATVVVPGNSPHKSAKVVGTIPFHRSYGHFHGAFVLGHCETNEADVSRRT